MPAEKVTGKNWSTADFTRGGFSASDRAELLPAGERGETVETSERFLFGVYISC